MFQLPVEHSANSVNDYYAEIKAQLHALVLWTLFLRPANKARELNAQQTDTAKGKQKNHKEEDGNSLDIFSNFISLWSSTMRIMRCCEDVESQRAFFRKSILGFVACNNCEIIRLRIFPWTSAGGNCPSETASLTGRCLFTFQLLSLLRKSTISCATFKSNCWLI